MDLGKIEKLYSENFDKFGIDSKSVGWNSPNTQQLRFEKLLMVVQNRSESFSLNELGCGYGELFKYATLNGYNINLFNGYDISEKMLLAAKDYLNDSKAVFFKEASIITKADYTITSGIFNVKFDEQKDRWETYIKDTLKNMFENSNKGMSFNLLTKYVDFEAKDLYYADPLYYFDFCKKELSRYVNLIHDYNLYEWTIIVKK
ncbi:MAG: class I SAM-dependent methyltransferase [Bacteroidota bacterium]|nr:class I SAM-dependent methyltransferase [Bacteroidota bacterium]